MKKKSLLTLFFLIFSVICFVCVYHLYVLYKIDTPQQEKYGILICNSVYFLGIGSFLASLYVHTKDEDKKMPLKNTDSTLEEDFGSFKSGTEYRAKVKHITENGWEGRVSSVDTWVANSKEELFERLLKSNHSLQNTYESYEFKSHELMNEYDEWWAKLSEERKAQIQGEDMNTQTFEGRFCYI